MLPEDFLLDDIALIITHLNNRGWEYNEANIDDTIIPVFTLGKSDMACAYYDFHYSYRFESWRLMKEYQQMALISFESPLTIENLEELLKTCSEHYNK